MKCLEKESNFEANLVNSGSFYNPLGEMIHLPGQFWNLSVLLPTRTKNLILNIILFAENRLFEYCYMDLTVENVSGEFFPSSLSIVKDEVCVFMSRYFYEFFK